MIAASLLRSGAVARRAALRQAAAEAGAPAPRAAESAARSLSSSAPRCARVPEDGSATPRKEEDSAAAEKAPEPQAAPPSQPRRDVRRSTSFADIDTSLAMAAIEGETGGKGGKTNAKARGAQTSQDRQRKQTARIFGVLGLVGVGAIVGNMGREWETIEERQKYADDPSAQGFFGRVSTRMRSMYTSVKDPAWEKLLPDPLPFPYQRPYTLVLDVDKLLVSSTWTRKDAWRTAKRPGLDYFLGYLSQFYEIVIFTRQPFYIAGPVIEKLDPDRRYVTYNLFRESCKTSDSGNVVKDLSFLNRDLSKVIVLDTDPTAFELQPENGIVVQKWEGDPKDTELVGLIPFLESIGIYGIEDVRKPIKAYEGTHIPTEHAKRLASTLQADEADRKTKQSKRLFGGLRESAGAAPQKSWYESERERYMQAFQEDQKYWRENGEALRRQAKEEQERQIKEMKLSAWGMLTGQGMAPPPGAEGAAAPAS